MSLSDTRHVIACAGGEMVSREKVTTEGAIVLMSGSKEDAQVCRASCNLSVYITGHQWDTGLLLVTPCASLAFPPAWKNVIPQPPPRRERTSCLRSERLAHQQMSVASWPSGIDERIKGDLIKVYALWNLFDSCLHLC